MAWTGIIAKPVIIDVSTLKFDDADFAWSESRLSDGATNRDGGYWYMRCNLCGYYAESHFKGSARSNMTKHDRVVHG